jgi:uncharacterized protein
MKLKHLSLAFLVGLACLLLIFGGCGTTQRLAGRGDFEPEPKGQPGPNDWVPTVIPETKEFVDFLWDEEVMHGGQRSVAIAIDPDHPDDIIFYNWTKVVPTWQEGQTYVLSGWVKSENLGGTASLLVQCWPEDKSQKPQVNSTQKLHAVTGTTDWTEVGTVFTVPAGTAEVRIRAGLSTKDNLGGRVWFDDIQWDEIHETTQADSLDIMKGMWVGTLNAGAELRLVLNVVHSQWQVTLDSVDQGAYGLDVSNLVVDGDAVSFDLEIVKASYSGRIVDSDHIEGTWSQGLQFPLNFERTLEEPKVNRPQEPKEPFPYTSEEVAYTYDPKDSRNTLVNGVGHGQENLITMKGTLTLPPGDGPHPAILLISGSGPQDRDESLLGHKPFWVLADFLTRHGFAVLRVDDRGTAHSTGDFSMATSKDFALDAGAGFQFLQGREDIAGDRVGLLGHSEGGLIAPMVAVANPEVAAIVLMAGPGVSGREILSLQTRLILESQGMPADRMEFILNQQQKMLELMSGDLAGDEFSSAVDDLLREGYQGLTEEEKTETGTLENYMQVTTAQWNTPWMRYFLKYDPGPTLSQVTCPVLAVNGGNDLQVDPDQNLPAISAALTAGGLEDFTVQELPGLNHLFQPSETGALAEYALIEETLSPMFLEIVTIWLRERLMEND